MVLCRLQIPNTLSLRCALEGIICQSDVDVAQQGPRKQIMRAEQLWFPPKVLSELDICDLGSMIGELVGAVHLRHSIQGLSKEILEAFSAIQRKTGSLGMSTVFLSFRY